MSQAGAAGSFLNDALSQTHTDAVTDASQRVGDGGDDLPSQGEFGFYGYASQGSQMDFDFKEGSGFDFKEGSASQASDWAHAMSGQADDADGIAGAVLVVWQNSVLAFDLLVLCSR
jgi:hypothetical protein